MSDDPLLCCRQQCSELVADGTLSVRDLGPVCTAQQIALGHLDAAQGNGRRQSDQVFGFTGFKGRLAQPFQGSRHWSRSQPLPLSRSFQ